MVINGSVGRGGANQKQDVRLVQNLLNDARAKTGDALLIVDGIAGPKTNAAIEQYQRRQGLVTDGRIDPSGPTLKSLINAFVHSLAAGIIDPPLPLGSSQPAADVELSSLEEYLKRLGGQA